MPLFELGDISAAIGIRKSITVEPLVTGAIYRLKTGTNAKLSRAVKDIKRTNSMISVSPGLR
jgi:hypothetical protein